MARRRKGEGSIYQRHDHPTCPPLIDGPPGKNGKPTRIRPDHKCRGTWTTSLDLGWKEGSRRRKVIYGQTQKAVVAKLNKAKLDLATQGDLATRSMSVEAWMTLWLDEICPTKERMRPKTLQGYRSRAKYITAAIGKTRLDRVGAAHVRAVRSHILGLGLSSTTAGHAHAALSTALNDAKREGLITRNPTELVDKPGKAPSNQTSLTVEQAHKFLRAVEHDRLASRWLAGLLLGARQGELLGLEWDRVNLDEGWLDLSWQLQPVPYKHGCSGCGKRPQHCPQRELAVLPGFEYRQLQGGLCLQRPKTAGSIRVLPTPEPLVLALTLWQETYEAERVDYKTDHGLVWPRSDGHPRTARDDGLAWAAHLAAAGLPAVHQHSTRHTTATLLLAIDTPQEVIRAILGHSDAVTTRGYQHVDLSLQRAALSKLALELGPVD